MNKKALKAFKTALVAVGANGMLVNAEHVKALVADGLAEVNTSIAVDANGNIPARATQKLIDEIGTKAAPAPVAEKPKFEIVADAPFVPGVRGGVKEEVYPFSKLEVGQSFLVPVSDDKPTPEAVVEKFGSTVSSATRRFSEKTGETKLNKEGKTVDVLKATRRFTLRPVTQGQTYPGSKFVEPASGARVYRTA